MSTIDYAKLKDDYVWYVSYGSNMLRERFMKYIEGGSFEGGGANHVPCADTSAPLEVKTFDIPYDMYFRNASTVWGGKGVSYLDIAKAGHAHGVAYLITRAQFEHVACQENGGNPPAKSPGRYNTVLKVGTMDGLDVVTITNDETCNFNPPSEAYLTTLKRGMQENYTDMSEEEIDRYLQGCIRA